MSKKAPGDIEFLYEPPFPAPQLLAKQPRVLPLPDGKRYLADGEQGGTVAFVARVNSDGSPDEGFGPGGWRAEFLASGGGSMTTAGLIPREGGGVLAALVNHTVIGFVCFNPDGTLDADFGVDGKIVHAVRSSPLKNSASKNEVTDETAPGSLGAAGGFGAAVPGADGKIYGLVGPRFGVGQPSALMRCNSDGQLDTSFNGSGSVILRHPGLPDLSPHGNGVVATPDSGAVVAGMLGGQTESDMRGFFCRYEADGSLDTRFGDGGFAVFDSASAGIPVEKLSQMELNYLTPLADGGFAASGYLTAKDPWLYFGLVICVDAEGRLLTSFNSGRPLLFQFSIGAESSFIFGGIVEQLNGRIVVGGDVTERSSGYQQDVLVVRFLSDGSLDPDFAEGGRLRLQPYGHRVTFLDQVVLDTDGRILVMGAGGPNDDIFSARDFVLQLYSS